MLRIGRCLFVVSLLALAACAPPPPDKSKPLQALARLQVISMQLSRVAQDAAGGNVDAFKSLTAMRSGMAALIKQADAMPATDAKTLDASWAKLDADVGTVLETQAAIVAIRAAADDVNAKLPVLNSRFNEAIDAVKKQGATVDDAVAINRLMLLVDRMTRRVQAVLQGDEASPSAATGLQRDVAFFQAYLKALINGAADLDVKKVRSPDAGAILGEISKSFEEIAPALARVLEGAADLQKAKEAADKAQLDAQELMLHADSLMSRSSSKP